MDTAGENTQEKHIKPSSAFFRLQCAEVMKHEDHSPLQRAPGAGVHGRGTAVEWKGAEDQDAPNEDS